MKHEPMTVERWRNSHLHRRCEFCKFYHYKYQELDCPYEWHECTAKGKIVVPRAIKPFCRLFVLKENKNARP